MLLPVSGVPTGGRGGAIGPPLLLNDGPRDSSKIKEKMAGYKFGKNLSEKWPDEMT